MNTLITDRHHAVMKYLRESRPDVLHKFDAWHMAKGLISLYILFHLSLRCLSFCCIFINGFVGVAKKIDQLGKLKVCSEVITWKRSIVNHLYWCGASSSTGSEIVAKWKSVANHIQDIHEHGGEFPKCLHEPLVGEQARQWLKPSNGYI